MWPFFHGGEQRASWGERNVNFSILHSQPQGSAAKPAHSMHIWTKRTLVERHKFHSSRDSSFASTWNYCEIFRLCANQVRRSVYSIILYLFLLYLWWEKLQFVEVACLKTCYVVYLHFTFHIAGDGPADYVPLLLLFLICIQCWYLSCIFNTNFHICPFEKNDGQVYEVLMLPVRRSIFSCSYFYLRKHLPTPM